MSTHTIAYDTDTTRLAAPRVDGETGIRRTTAATMLASTALFFAAYGVLSSLGWPAILQAPASTVLPLLQQHAARFALGYGAYFFSSALIIAGAMMLRRALADDSIAMRIGTTFGVLAGVAKMLGLVRWLVAFPVIARIYTDPTTDPATRDTLGVVYTALNLYGDSIGQQLGDILFVAPWVGLVSLAALRTRTLPRWLTALGLVTGVALLIGFFAVFNLPVAPLVYGGFVGYAVWFLAVGIVLLRNPRRASVQ